MLSLDNIIDSLRFEAQRIDHLSSDAAWYIFGSSRDSFNDALDIDILILCTDDASTCILRRELQSMCLKFPLHLFLLTRCEEAELKFIEQQGCRMIYPEFL